MADKRPFTDAELNGLFDAARREAPLPSGDLLARIAADAELEAKAVANSVPAEPRPAAPVARQRPGLWARLGAVFGGWPAVGGLVAAAATGVVLGFAAPDAVAAWAGEAWPLSAALGTGVEAGDFVPTLEAMLGEL